MRNSLAFIVLVALAFTPFVRADDSETLENGDTVSWHVVQPGQSLESITKSYLGTNKLWRENWRLNPDLDNPHLLRPGQRIRVITSRVEQLSAEIIAISRRVEEKPVPEDWRPAEIGDKLDGDDGVRTYSASSAGLRFEDGAELILTEDSLVYLRALSRTTSGIDQQTVELIDGQADLRARSSAGESSLIEMIIGDVSAWPKPGAGGEIASRARRSADGAQVMIYEGSSTVAAAGAQVEVPAGMGTSVAKGEVPSEPEVLLDAPMLATPAADLERDSTEISFGWQAVPGAASYTLEVCRDAACNSLIRRATGLEAAEWLPANRLPPLALHWRVTAISSSGLDGFPSPTRPLTITATGSDRLAPSAFVQLLGSGSATSDRIVLGPGAELRIVAIDDHSGIASFRYRLNQEKWRLSGDSWQPKGSGILEIEVIDNAGRSSSRLIEVVVDSSLGAR